PGPGLPLMIATGNWERFPFYRLRPLRRSWATQVRGMASAGEGRRTSRLMRGLIVGLCATQALDWVSIWLYEGQSRRARRAEDQARGGRHAYEVAIDRVVRLAGRRLSRRQRARWGWRFHKAFGLLGGLGYLAL